MIIRLTPELLATLQSPSPKPTLELVIKSAVEGSCISLDPDSGFKEFPLIDFLIDNNEN